MPLLKIELPALCGLFFSYLMKIASFDLIPIDNYLDEHVEMTPRDPINNNFEAIGFESMYVIINLGSILDMNVVNVLMLLLDSQHWLSAMALSFGSQL